MDVATSACNTLRGFRPSESARRPSPTIEAVRTSRQWSVAWWTGAVRGLPQGLSTSRSDEANVLTMDG